MGWWYGVLLAAPAGEMRDRMSRVFAELHGGASAARACAESLLIITKAKTQHDE